jgi:hypothetical protein
MSVVDLVEFGLIREAVASPVEPLQGENCGLE